MKEINNLFDSNIAKEIFKFGNQYNFFSFTDLNHFLKDKKIKKPAIKYLLKKFLKFGFIKYKKNLYSKGEIIDPYAFYCKINKNSILSYHTALEFYGLSHSVFNDIYLMNEKNLKPIYNLNAKNIFFIKPKLKIFQKYDSVTNNSILVTPLELTILDCLNNLNYCGGFEEFYWSLESLEKIDSKKMILFLKKYKVKKLFNLLGFILTHLEKNKVFKFDTSLKKFLKKNIYWKNANLHNINKDEKILIDKEWKVVYSKKIESILTGIY